MRLHSCSQTQHPCPIYHLFSEVFPIFFFCCCYFCLMMVVNLRFGVFPPINTLILWLTHSLHQTMPMMNRDKMTLTSASVIPRYLTASIVMVTPAGNDDSDNVIHQNIIWTGPVEDRCFSSQAVDRKKKHFHIKVFPSNQTCHLYFWMNTNFMQISPNQELE